VVSATDADLPVARGGGGGVCGALGPLTVARVAIRRALEPFVWGVEPWPGPKELPVVSMTVAIEEWPP
jgi:hypothetical protein